jgi:hypothetical protein
MKASPEEEGRIIAQSRFDVNEEISTQEENLFERKNFSHHDLVISTLQ